MEKNKKAQTTLEYIIVLTAIVAAVLAGAVIMTGDSHNTKGIKKVMSDASDIMGTASWKLVEATD